ncbi:hypothetical protein [Paenibacillus sp. 481]|uniref:hypothetical protein n=1 Tax=Paenibacillus sp. 481 TaxID=2835869 RepID=UPI001E39D2BF|nr:hypothetical protein [Paenibacillus sp. 481]UHA73619.1 hypothetical protein KIK04_00060 [Paenibacillus sp. 481]
MSPVLSRPDYYLVVLNQMNQEELTCAQGSLEWELRELLCLLAHSVQTKQTLHADMVQRINHAFQTYHAVQLKLRVNVPEHVHQETTSNKAGTPRQRLCLHTEFVDPPDKLRRVYMEAMISLLEAMEQEPFELQTCAQCQHWFIPYQRAQVAKFCQEKCRNRYHYLQKKHALIREEVR